MGVQFFSRLPEIEKGMAIKASNAVFKATKDVEGWGRAHAPVDTGFLSSSIQGRMSGPLDGVVNAGAEYAVYVEYGTSKMGAQPFMVPAAEAVRSSFIAAMSQIA